MFVDPATVGVHAGQVFIFFSAPSDGDGPMRRRVEFWEVTAVTARRVWAAEMRTETVREVPDSDGVFNGGRMIAPIRGSHVPTTRSLMRVSVSDRGEVSLHLPRRRTIWRATAAARWDGSPQFTHRN